MRIHIFDLLGYVILICIWLIIFPQKKEQAVDLTNHLIPFIFLYLGGELMKLIFPLYKGKPPLPDDEKKGGKKE